MIPFVAPLLTSIGTAAAGFAGSSLFRYVQNKISPPQQPINFDSPIYRNSIGIQQEEGMLAQNSRNPYNMGLSPYADIAQNVAARNFLQAQQVNAQYDPRLRSQFNQQQLQDATYGNILTSAQPLIGYGVEQGLNRLDEWWNGKPQDTSLKSKMLKIIQRFWK